MEPVPGDHSAAQVSRRHGGLEFWPWSKPWLFVGYELHQWMDDAHRRPHPASRNSAAPARSRRTLRHGEFAHATALRRARFACVCDADTRPIKVVPRRRGAATDGHLKRPDIDREVTP
jgi:hypothetical protein